MEDTIIKVFGEVRLTMETLISMIEVSQRNILELQERQGRMLKMINGLAEIIKRSEEKKKVDNSI